MSEYSHYKIIDQRTYYAAISCLMVFVVVHWFESYYGQVAAGIACCLLITFIAHRLKKKPTYEDSRLLRISAWLSMLLMLCFTIWANTMGSTYFIFPLMLAGFIIFPKDTALLLGLLASLATSLIALKWLNGTDLFRYCTAQLLVMSIGYIYANIVDRNEQKLEQLANTDPLTQVFNRHELHHRLNQALAHCRRYQRPACLIMIDLDHFKSINDRYGHLTGDKVLIEVCEVIQQRVRETDMLFRYGGEEFALLLPNETLAEAQIMAEDLRTRIAQHKLTDEIQLTVSLGVAEANAEDTDQSLLKRADTALYQAKASRNSVSVVQSAA